MHGRQDGSKAEETSMNEEIFNLSLRKFLKKVGVGSQNEIEKAVAQALAEKRISGNEVLPATMTLEVGGIQLTVKFEGTIALE
jgi:Family of unknown function (DUF6494)